MSSPNKTGGWLFVLTIAVLAGTACQVKAANFALQGQQEDTSELHVRGALPNVAAKIAAGDEVRVAFLGGSITAADGWRALTLEHLRSTYPQARFTEIFAAVPGTGSDYGAARLGRDVLAHRPDLVFVEFAVNDGHGTPQVEAQMEGIVRQAWRAIPRADLCFVYTVADFQIDALLGGHYQSTAASMERVAQHYQIPSLNWGIEVARRVSDHSLRMWAPSDVKANQAGNDPEGRLVFTRDHTHPTEAGHRLYAERLALALPRLMKGPALAHPLPAALHADNWERARLVPLSEIGVSTPWRLLPPGAPQLALRGATGLVPPIWSTFTPGASISFHFRGTRFGLIGLKGPDNGMFRVTVDGMLEETSTLFDSFSTPGRYVLKPWFWSPVLEDVEHSVRVELLSTKIDKGAIMAGAGVTITDRAAYAPHGLYLGGVLIVGEARP